jgi:hypothetical protein
MYRKMVESVELVEKMKILKREVKRYIAYNERLIKNHEYNYHTNTKLLHSLNNLQRKNHKESNTRHATSVGN